MADALAETIGRGAGRLLGRIRAWERANIDHGHAPKAADDVTLIQIRLGACPSAGHLHRSATSLLWRTSPFGWVRPDRLEH